MKYNVNLTDKANSKIKYWVGKCDKEVSGFGITIYDSTKKEFVVTDVFLIEQTVGAAHTDISPEGMAKLMYNTRNEIGSLNFWWHSHVNMDVFWSGQDMETIMKLGSNGFIVASVFNKREEIRTAIAYVATSALNENKPETVFYDDVDTFVIRPELDKAFTDDLDRQFTELVKDEPMRIFPTQFHHNYGLFDEYDNIDLIATSNIIDASDGRMGIHPSMMDDVDKALSNAELNELCDPQQGAFGFGFFVEAKLLGLTAKTYKRILKSNNSHQMINIEDRLIKAEADNQISSMKNRLCKSESGM